MSLFQWYYSPFWMLGAFWLTVGNANAAATCSASMSAGTVNIGNNLTADNIDSESITATLNYKCSNGIGRRFVSVCLAVDGGDIASEINPRYMKKSGANTPRLAFTMLKPDQTLWGTRTLTGINSEYIAYHEMPSNTSISIDVPIKVALLPNYSNSIATPGVYTNNFNAGHTALTYQDRIFSTSSDCKSGRQDDNRFPFIVQATVINSCEITTTNDVNLGNYPASDTNIIGSNSNAIGITCTKDAPYTIGLAPSNGNQAGSGVMSGTGSNNDKVPYQLRSAPGFNGKTWGNTATSTSTGNGVADIGNGLVQNKTVYVTVPSADFRPDNYSDTVTIKVNY